MPREYIGSPVLFILILLFAAPRTALGESPSMVSADDIMVKIRLGLPVEYDKVAIIGNLTSERLGLTAKQILRIPFEVKMLASDGPMQANSSIVIKNSIIYGRVDFNNTVFHKHVRFENTFFVENASFENSTFNGDATFAHSMFMKTGSFAASQFRKGKFSADLFQWASILHMALNLAAWQISALPSSALMFNSFPANLQLMPSLTRRILEEIQTSWDLCSARRRNSIGPNLKTRPHLKGHISPDQLSSRTYLQRHGRFHFCPV